MIDSLLSVELAPRNIPIVPDAIIIVALYACQGIL
jgi:hypothetical protein